MAVASPKSRYVATLQHESTPTRIGARRSRDGFQRALADPRFRLRSMYTLAVRRTGAVRRCIYGRSEERTSHHHSPTHTPITHERPSREAPTGPDAAPLSPPPMKKSLAVPRTWSNP